MKGAFFDLTVAEKTVLDLITDHNGPMSAVEILNDFPPGFFVYKTHLYAVLNGMIDNKDLLSITAVPRKAHGEHSKRKEYALTARGELVHEVSEMISSRMTAPPRTRAKKKARKKTR